LHAAYLFKISFDGRSIRSETIFELPSQILSHVSRSPDEHVVLDLGATTHLFRGKSHTTWETPFDDFVDKICSMKGENFTSLEMPASAALRKDSRGDPSNEARGQNLRTIHGQPGGDVYVAGFDGVLLRLAGGKWNRFRSTSTCRSTPFHVASDWPA